MIERLDHVNLRTTRLADMIAWYEQVMGLTSGPRPNFPFPGAWLYGGGNPLVHLVEIDAAPARPADLALEHAAFRASDFTGFIGRLEEQGEVYRRVEVRDFGIVQINLWDPDGNHLHVDFDVEEVQGSEAAAFEDPMIKA